MLSSHNNNEKSDWYYTWSPEISGDYFSLYSISQWETKYIHMNRIKKLDVILSFFFFFPHCNLCFLCVFQQPNMCFNGFWQYIVGLQDIVGLIASLCRWSRQKCKKDRRGKMSRMNVGPTISFFSTRSLMLHFFSFFLSQPKQFYVIFYCISQRSLTFNRYFFHNYAYTAL